MASWIIPCNPRCYDIFGAFKKLKTVDWRQSAKSIDVGDTVYIYVGKPVQAIMYKTHVIAAGFPESESENSDAEFNLQPIPELKLEYSKRLAMRLQIVGQYSPEDMTFEKMAQHGLKGNIMGPRHVDGGIQALIDSVELAAVSN